MDQETILHTVVAAQPGWSLAMFLEGGKEPDGKEYEAGFAQTTSLLGTSRLRPAITIPMSDGLAKNGYIALPRRSRRMALTSTTSITIRRPDGVYFIPEDRDARHRSGGPCRASSGL